VSTASRSGAAPVDRPRRCDLQAAAVAEGHRLLARADGNRAKVTVLLYEKL
jgi:hypothetical protein